VSCFLNSTHAVAAWLSPRACVLTRSDLIRRGTKRLVCTAVHVFHTCSVQAKLTLKPYVSGHRQMCAMGYGLTAGVCMVSGLSERRSLAGRAPREGQAVCLTWSIPRSNLMTLAWESEGTPERCHLGKHITRPGRLTSPVYYS
jgi:hypothetical protein